MKSFTVIGTGTMGSAITDVLGRGGAEVQTLGHDDMDVAATGDVIVLAVPFPAVDEIIESRRDQLDSKIIADITNPLDFETFDSLVVPPDSSAAAHIARALPSAKVVKAFNTTFGGTLGAGVVGPVTTTVLLAGDDDDAKSSLAEVVRAAGLNAIDVGALKRARELEALGFLQISLAAKDKISWMGGFGVVQ
jgi:8-hydroxy-5-deazaflavin:NADPH oxidoreductase